MKMTYIRITILAYVFTDTLNWHVLGGKEKKERLGKKEKKNKRTCQRTHVQNCAYANKGRGTYVRDVHRLSNPVN